MAVSAGLDTSFGDDGKLVTGARTLDSVLAVTGAIFVNADTAGGRFIYKYDGAGNRDATWGKKGRVGLSFGAEALAFDKRTGALDAAGPDAADGTSLEVLRLTKFGIPESTFGNGGLSTYDSGTSIHVKELLPLAQRQLAVVLERSSTQTVNGSSETINDVAVMRLRQNGSRDPNFGTHGIVTTNSGVTDRTYGNDGFFTALDDVPAFGSLLPLDDGSFRLTAARQYTVERGLVSDSNSLNDDFNYTFQIKDRTISAAGVLDPTKLFSWTLIKPTGSDAVTLFTPTFIAGNGHSDVTVLGQYQRGGVIQQQSYHFQPTFSPHPTTTSAAGLMLNTLVRNARNVYFGATKTLVTRLRGDLSIDRRFGSHGGVTVRGTIDSLAADASGGVLAVSDGVLYRLP